MSTPADRNDECLIRPALANDLPRIVELLVDDVLGARRESLTDQSLASYEQAFAAIKLDPHNEVCVATVDDEIVGCFQWTLIPNLSFCGGLQALSLRRACACGCVQTGRRFTTPISSVCSLMRRSLFLIGMPALSELLQSFSHVRPRDAALMAMCCVPVMGDVYAIPEGQIAMTFSPAMAESYNGQQGDAWDAQKDLALAWLGAFLMLPMLYRWTPANVASHNPA